MQPADGRVMQVNVSAGGVPKLPVERAWVGRLGLAGDGHRDRTEHGGPHRAVCLFAIEAIERLQADGHPVEPGSTGENLTTSGIEWSLLPIGTRARIGAELELELASSTTPCATQKPNFLGGRFSRISIDLHPSDSRMYARVLHEGEVRPGDAISLLPPAPDSRAEQHALLNRIEVVDGESSLRLWRAARAAGIDVRVLDDGELVAGATPALPTPAFNHAHGLRRLPHLLPEVLEHFDRARSAGLIPYEAPTPGAQPDHQLAVHACPPAEVIEVEPTAGLDVQLLAESDQPDWISVFTDQLPAVERHAWAVLLPALLMTRGVYPFIAKVDGRPIGTGLLHVKHSTGLLRGAVVLPAARGQGVQRALIAQRARLATELGCTLLASSAAPGSVSACNLERTGLAVIETHPVFRYEPAAVMA
jgi:MOSC domain-containing protein YiiM/GNAT superfamily N-acetyltransferase